MSDDEESCKFCDRFSICEIGPIWTSVDRERTLPLFLVPPLSAFPRRIFEFTLEWGILALLSLGEAAKGAVAASGAVASTDIVWGLARVVRGASDNGTPLASDHSQTACLIQQAPKTKHQSTKQNKNRMPSVFLLQTSKMVHVEPGEASTKTHIQLHSKCSLTSIVQWTIMCSRRNTAGPLVNKVAASLRGAIISLQFILAERVDGCNHRLCKGAARVVVPGGVSGPSETFQTLMMPSSMYMAKRLLRL